MNYEQLLGELSLRQRFGIRPGLERMHQALAALGHPEKTLPVIHIAGTNGKGSTAAFAESISRTSGRRTGIFTSPHLLRFTERIRLNGNEIAPQVAAELGTEVLRLRIDLTYFEVGTLMALLAFARASVDVAIIECGLGGRLDSTNVFDHPLATVVASVARDHTEILGETIEQIALEKAGIFRFEVPAIIGRMPIAAATVVEGHARAVGAPLFRLHQQIELCSGDLGLAGAHQRENAALAVAAVTHAFGELPTDAVPRGLAEPRWPGRLEWLAPDVLVDGAHNPDGAETLARELEQLRVSHSIALIFGAAADKQIAAMLKPLQQCVDQLIVTPIPSSRSATLSQLSAQAPAATAAGSLTSALQLARERADLVVIAGSLFLVGAARQLLLGDSADPISVQDPSRYQSGRPESCPSGPPQIRTCEFPASGSSDYGFATR